MCDYAPKQTKNLKYGANKELLIKPTNIDCFIVISNLFFAEIEF
jgi:hypothetical protein